MSQFRIRIQCFEKLDPDPHPHLSEKLGLDPDPQLRQNSGAFVARKGAVDDRGHSKRRMEAQIRGVEAQNGGLKGHWSQIRITGAGSGSGFTLK
jgi:hypothetical protein